MEWFRENVFEQCLWLVQGSQSFEFRKMMPKYSCFEYSFTFRHGLEVLIAVTEEFVPIWVEAPFAKVCFVYFIYTVLLLHPQNIRWICQRIFHTLWGDEQSLTTVIGSRTRHSRDHSLQLCHAKPHFLGFKWSLCYCRKQADENVKRDYVLDVITIVHMILDSWITPCAMRGSKYLPG